MKKWKRNFIFARECLKAKLLDNSGQGSIETAVQILIAVVLGALILAGLYALMQDNILPTLTEKIEEMFNYSN